MAWDFTTDPEFEEQLEWMRTFVKEEVEPLELLWPHHHHRVPPPWLRPIVDPLKQQVRDRGLWACHLPPELGGGGYGNVKLTLMNEILGPYFWGPTIFGTQGPDTGNAEVIAHYGTDEQKARYLEPLLAGEMFSAYSMTEPQGGSDPGGFRTTAVRDGDEWVITGEKFFSSNAPYADLLVVMAITNPDVPVHRGSSMFLVPADTPGIEILRHTGTMGEPYGVGMGHPHVRYDNVRVPADAILGPEGRGFEVSQTRLSGGRLHHAMRTIGVCQRAFDMMCERALSRQSFGGPIADKQLVQHAIAESYVEIEQFRLFVLRTAWRLDRGEPYRAVRGDIAAAKNLAYTVSRSVIERAVHIHGALGCSNEMPLGEMWMAVPTQGLMDGPWELHTMTVARQILKQYSPSEGLWPSAWLPAAVDSARSKHAAVLEAQAAHEAGADH